MMMVFLFIIYTITNQSREEPLARLEVVSLKVPVDGHHLAPEYLSVGVEHLASGPPHHLGVGRLRGCLRQVLPPLALSLFLHIL